MSLRLWVIQKLLRKEDMALLVPAVTNLTWDVVHATIQADKSPANLAFLDTPHGTYTTSYDIFSVQARFLDEAFLLLTDADEWN